MLTWTDSASWSVSSSSFCGDSTSKLAFPRISFLNFDQSSAKSVTSREIGGATVTVTGPVLLSSVPDCLQPPRFAMERISNTIPGEVA